MTVLDVPCTGRATFRRLSVRSLHETLLANETRQPSVIMWDRSPRQVREIISTFLRPIAYLARGIGT